jgi:hypothetical protein
VSKIKKTLIEIVQLNGVTVATLPLILAASIGLVAAYIKTVNLNMTVFYERAIGHASINGADAPMRVTAFWICLAVFILSLLLVNFIISRTKNCLTLKFPEHSFASEKTLLFEFSILLFINELIYLYRFVKNTGNKNQIITLVIAFAAVCLHLLISILRAHKNLPSETHLQSTLAFLIPIPLTYFILLFISIRHTSTIYVVSIKSAVIYILFYLLLKFLLNKKIYTCAAAYALIPLSFLPLAYIIANETQYTLTKHGIVINPKIIALGFFILLYCIALFVYFLKHKNSSEELALKKIDNIVLPVLLVTAGIFATHYQVIPPNFDLLHNGNKTLPAQQFLQFGNIPLLDIWEHQNLPILPFLYGIINGLNFLEQNIWLDMSYMIVNILICYFVLRQFMNARWAALLVLFTPIIVYANQYYMAGLLPLVYLRKMRERRTAFDYGVFFALGLAAFVYHSSSGFIAVIAGLVIIAMSCSSKKNIIDAIKGVVIAAGIPVIIYFSLVLLRGENIPDRLALISALSRQDILICAYSGFIGDNRTPFEILVYLGIFPMLGIASAYLALRAKDKTAENYGIVFIAAATIICSLRALARHSLVEGLPQDYYPLLFVLVPFVLIKYKTKAKIISMLVFAVLLITPYAATSYGVAANGIKDFTFMKFEAGDERCDTFNNSAYPSNLRKVLDTVLTDDQTFFETINGYLLYALMERECTFLPVSTLMIQYERPQIAYIHTLEKLYKQNKVPIIITGQSDWWGCAIDGIPSELSLFKLAEWIYAHYEPWIWVDGFHLWKAKNSGIELSELPEEDIIADVPLYTAKSSIKQDFNMIMLPYVWGNFDKKVNKHSPEEQQRIADNLPLESGKPVTLTLDSGINKSEGNYIYFRIRSLKPGNMTLRYGNDIINSCNFNIAAGDYNYLVRISSQYNWVNEPQTWLEIVSTEPVTIERLSVLKGD